MTTPLLENELVRKYFGCDLCTSNWGNKSHACFERISYRIFQAMSEPIKKGESWLELYGNGRVELNEGYDDDGFDPMHPYFLRLPDRFQPSPEREVAKIAHVCDCEFCGHPDTVFLRTTKIGQPASTAKCERCGKHE